jgi:hypothetical protein
MTEKGKERGKENENENKGEKKGALVADLEHAQLIAEQERVC